MPFCESSATTVANDDESFISIEALGDAPDRLWQFPTIPPAKYCAEIETLLPTVHLSIKSASVVGLISWLFFIFATIPAAATLLFIESLTIEIEPLTAVSEIVSLFKPVSSSIPTTPDARLPFITPVPLTVTFDMSPLNSPATPAAMSKIELTPISDDAALKPVMTVSEMVFCVPDAERWA